MKIEERLAVVQPEGPAAEAMAARARVFVDLSRRFSNANNLAAAEVQASLAERFTGVAEGKEVQR